MEKLVKRIYDGVGKWTDERGYQFIKELILSGDIYLVERQPTIVTEDNLNSKTATCDFANLWCYEPYREKMRLQEEYDKLKKHAERMAEEIESIFECHDILEYYREDFPKETK